MSDCISTWYTTFEFEHTRMVKSLTHFHPEVNLEVTTPTKYARLQLCGWQFPILELPLFDRYDVVSHIDADVLVVDRIDELLYGNGDVRAGRNNSDNNRCTCLPGVTLPGIPWDKYMNCGIHSVSSRAFMQEWLDFTLAHGTEYPHIENDTFNILFYSGRYDCTMLDPLGSDVYYGTTIVEGTVGAWDIWRNIVVAGDHLELNGKRIKMMHMAGGGFFRPRVEELVSAQVTQFLHDMGIL